jgi:hypothetical protein
VRVNERKMSVTWWMRTGMGWMFRKLCRWEVGGTSGMVTDDSEMFRLDNLESEVVGGAFGAPDRGQHK